MKNTISSLFTIFIFYSSFLNAQTSEISGRVLDYASRTPLIGAHITLIEKQDSLKKSYAMTDRDGKFLIHNIHYGSYRMKISFLGYDEVLKTFVISSSTLDAGIFLLRQRSIELKDVLVESTVPPVDQVGDTVQFNSKAYKVNADANAEELVSKLPGVTVEGTTVKAQGEDVKQVLVDGKRFFGDDPMIALRNLPAEVIEKIQVYDKLSDQAELTGFDDGQTTKTMNIITRSNRRQGQFGRVAAAVGEGRKYQVGGSLNSFQQSQRISLLGQSNNINQQNFSMQDFLGVLGSGMDGGMRGGGGMRSSASGGQRGGGRGQMPIGSIMGGPPANFFVGQQNGISTTHAIGGQYTDEWSENLRIEGNYFFNFSNNQRDEQTKREYFSLNDTNQIYRDSSLSDRDNYNHRFNARIEYAIDSSNSLMISPRMSLQLNSSNSNSLRTNAILDTILLSRSTSASSSDVTGYTSSGSMVYRHRFQLPGRSFSLQMNLNLNDRTSDRMSNSISNYYSTSLVGGDMLDNTVKSTVDGYGVSATIAYTEPLSVNALLQVNYAPSYREQSSDKRSYRFNALNGFYDLFDATLSNTLQSIYRTHVGNLGVQYREDELIMSAGVGFQRAMFSANRSFPTTLTTQRTFDNILPTASFRWRFSRTRGIQIMYRTATEPPSVTQLENTIDNSNALLLTTGNPDLKQYYTHTMTARYNNTNVVTMQSVFFLISGSMTLDYIGNSTIQAQRDTMLTGSILLRQGSQLSKPVNLDNQRSFRTMLTYSLPVSIVGALAHFNIGYTNTTTPSLINNQYNRSNSVTISPGLSLNSNISEDFDYMAMYGANFNTVKNSSQTGYQYFYHTASGRIQWTFWEGFYIRTDARHQLNRNRTTNLEQKYTVWNAGFGKKLFANDRGEISFQVFDLLNENKNVVQTAEDTYLEEQRTNNLTQYYLLTFSYRLSSIGEMFRENPPPPPPPM